MKSLHVSKITGIIFLLIITSTSNGVFNENYNLSSISSIQINNKIVLVTGFGPFGGHDINPSEYISENLSGLIINNVSIIGITLPVDYSDSFKVITAAIEEYNPILIISLGLAANYISIGVERIALNLMRIEKDNWPYYNIQRIDKNGPLFRVSHLPSLKIVKVIRDNGIPAETSFYAGIYICNALLYNVLGYVKENYLKIKAGFIHVPLLKSQNPEGLNLEEMITGITIAIEESLNHFYKNDFTDFLL